MGFHDINIAFHKDEFVLLLIEPDSYSSSFQLPLVNHHNIR